MRTFETVTSTNELVAAIELDSFTSFIYGLMGYNPDGLGFEVSVWRNADAPDLTPEEVFEAELSEVAPLHQTFHETWQGAEDAAKLVAMEIENGTFTYNPPVLPSN